MPNVGPIEACRMETVACLPMTAMAWPRPMAVVVLPSPSGVGVTAVTTTYFALGRSASAAMAARSILATCSPYGSVSQGGIPISAAISATGLSVACRGISSAVGMAIVLTTFPCLRLGPYFVSVRELGYARYLGAG